MAVDEIEFFREMTLRICGALDIEKALTDSFEYLRRHVPADAMGLGFNNLDMADEGAASIFVLAKAKQESARYIWKDESDEIPLPREAVEYTRSIPEDFPTTFAVNRLEDQHPSLHNVFPGIASDSAVFVRLELVDGMPGVLLVSAKGHDRYSSGHIQLLESIREPFAIAMTNARRYREVIQLKDLLLEDNRALTEDIKRAVGQEVVGADFGLRAVMEQVRQVAPSTSPVLLLGETGTGKEIIANAIHMASKRGSGPMIALQCGAIPETLLDSELFGHEKGAFTGAVERRRGRFERAHGGTLFLDEIGELSPDAQVKLLRVLQEQRFERVGGTETIEVDVRVIAATHRDLEKMVRDGSFREDLWYRLNVLPVRIPPLRLRREDIPSLVQYFVQRKAREMNLTYAPSISHEDLERLARYDWPGNVRELQNIVERSLLLSRGERLVFPELATQRSPDAHHVSARESGGNMTMDAVITSHIRSVLEQTRWKVSGPGGAAELLEMNASTLRFRMQKLGIHRSSG